MSRFYGTIHGQAKTPATRQGGTNTGISGHICGWDVGVKVVGGVVDGVDEFNIYATGGNNAADPERLIATVSMTMVGGNLAITYHKRLSGTPPIPVAQVSYYPKTRRRTPHD